VASQKNSSPLAHAYCRITPSLDLTIFPGKAKQ
jgi:hypothetical protein